MTVKIVLITHENIGQALINTAKTTLAQSLDHVYSISIEPNDDPEVMYKHLEHVFNELAPHGTDFLLLTDILGATPCNIATKLLREHEEINIGVVTGLNLPMLLKVLNYQELDLKTLEQKAIKGGKDSIGECQRKTLYTW